MFEPDIKPTSRPKLVLQPVLVYGYAIEIDVSGTEHSKQRDSDDKC